MITNHNSRIELAAVLTLSLGASASAHDGIWEDVRLASDLSSVHGEFESALSPDGLEMYFGSVRPGGFGSTDIYVATRESIEEPFSGIHNLGFPINNPGSRAPW